MLSTNSFSFLVVLLQEVTGIHVFISLFKKRGDVLSCIWRAGSKVGTNVNQKWKGWLRNSPNINTAVKILSLMELHPTQTLVWGQHGCLHGFSLLRFGFAPQVVLVPASWKVFCWAPDGHGFLKVLECLSHPFGQEKTGGEAGTPIACVGPYVVLTWSKVSSNPSHVSITQLLLWVLSNTDGEPVHVTMCLVSFGHGKSLSGLCWVRWSI